jgi:D-apiose dehydrogenase
MAKTLRCGLIGCGFFAQNHLQAWRELEGVEVAAVCDVDPAKARATAAAFQVPRAYERAEELLKAGEIDFVDIVTTPPSHRALVELAAGQGLPVICQKPIAWSMDDAQAMVEACRKAAVPFMIHENFRWQAPMREMRQLIDAGAIGRPFWGRLAFRNAHEPWHEQPWFLATERFIVVEVAVHLLDLARFFFGEPQTLFCHNLKISPVLRGEDVSTIMLAMEEATCLVESSFASQADPDPFPETFVTIEGTEGSISLERDYRLRIVRDRRLVEERPAQIPAHGWAEAPWHVVQDSVYNIQRHWLECLQQGRGPETSGEDNLRVLELVFGAYESAESGQAYRPSFAPREST